MTKTKAAIEELEALGAIEIVSKRPKQHVITILDVVCKIKLEKIKSHL